ncbi:MAG: carbohydrate-binding domain-containing protein [Methanomicrobiales archaeon]|nr:carbohydrate-binding domain-containing protein [Methanomicrobiales archaeon]MDD1679865.1 carbohydrate-binding domain-containing protein [Methanomicrobiales archaeon]
MNRIPYRIIYVLILFLLLPAGVSALVTYNGGQVTIDTPVADDVFASGGTVDINAPISSLIAAGGTININAPVQGDVIVAGGQVNANSNISGKLVAAGGNVVLSGDVGTNVVITGGTVEIRQEATIDRDALLSGGTVTNAGTVKGNLTVRAQTFTNTGTAGHLDVQMSESQREFSRIFSIFGAIFTIGMFILGLILIKLVPRGFLVVEGEVRQSAILKTIAGFFAIIISFFILVLLSISLVLLPFALICWMIFFIALILSTLFVALALGRLIARWTKWETANVWMMFLLGFIVLNLLFLIPVAGSIILVISVSLGFASFFHAMYVNWKVLTGESTPPPPPSPTTS